MKGDKINSVKDLSGTFPHKKVKPVLPSSGDSKIKASFREHGSEEARRNVLPLVGPALRNSPIWLK